MTATLTIIPNCIPLVHWFANKTNDHDKAFSAGLVGLASAIKNFDSHRGIKFSSYACKTIRWHIIRVLHPLKRQLAYQIKTVQQLYYQRTGNHLSPEQLATFLDEDESLIRDLLEASNLISIEKLKYLNEENIQFADNDAPLPEDDGTLEKSFVAEAVENILQDLPKDEQQILKLYYGIGRDSSYTQPQIASMLGVSSEAIRQKIDKILEKLSANRRLKELQLA